MPRNGRQGKRVVNMSKKKDTNVYATFLGESRNDVTGSSLLLNIPRKDYSRYNILIEMGLVQGGNTIKQDIANNRKMLERYNKDLIQSIDYVFVAHEHCDHHANLPYLQASGVFNGQVIMPKISIPIVEHLMEDSVKIHEANIRKLKEQGEKHIKPFYTSVDMYELFERFKGVEIGEKYRLNNEIEYRFINSGHVLGGAMLELWITKPNNSKIHLVYSSDMGSNHNNDFQYYVPPRDQVSKCNYFISEGTYNNPDRSWTKKQAIEERAELKSDIKNYLCSGKEILFSAFSFGRLQNILCMLYDYYHDQEWFKDIPVIIDGVLLHKINSDYLNVLKGEEKEHFQRVLNWSNLKCNKDYAGTLMILAKHEPRIIISTSGFLTNGRIVTYLQSMLGSSKAVIYLSGYCGGLDSLGAKILNPNQKTVTIDKKVVLKKATVKQLRTMSSHIQYDELMSLYRGLNCNKIIIHHSSEDGKENFGQEVREELAKCDKTTKVDVVTNKNYQFIL